MTVRPVVRFERVAPTSDALLAPSELARRDRLHQEADRIAYVAAHVLVRECAAELLGVAIDRVVIEQECPACGPRPPGQPQHGRPFVVGYPEVGVSLSHSRTHVAAVAASAGCGIDVERVVERVVETYPRAALTTAEAAWLDACADPAVGFTRLWVRKEALVKAGVAELGRVGELEVLQGDGPAAAAYGLELVEWSSGQAVGAVAFEA